MGLLYYILYTGMSSVEDGDNNNHKYMVFDIDPRAVNPDRTRAIPDNCGATTLASLGIINYRQAQSLSTRCSKANLRGEQGGITVANIIKILRGLRKDIPASVDYKLRILTHSSQSASESAISNNTVKALKIYFKYYAQMFLKPDGSNGIILMVNWRNGGGHFCVLVNNRGSPGIVDIQNFEGVLPLDSMFPKNRLGDPLQISVLEDTSPESGFVDDFMEPDENQDFWEMPEGFDDDAVFYNTIMTNSVSGKNQFEYNEDLDAIREISPKYVEHLGNMRSSKTKGKRYKPKDKLRRQTQKRKQKAQQKQSAKQSAKQSDAAEIRAKQHENQLLDAIDMENERIRQLEEDIMRIKQTISEVKQEVPYNSAAIKRYNDEYNYMRKELAELRRKRY